MAKALLLGTLTTEASAWSVRDMYKNLPGLNSDINLMTNVDTGKSKNVKRKKPLFQLMAQTGSRYMDDIEKEINDETEEKEAKASGKPIVKVPEIKTNNFIEKTSKGLL